MLIERVAEAAYDRLDVYVSSCGGMSRSRAKQLIESGCVTVDGKFVKAACRVEQGSKITVRMPEAQPIDVTAADIPIEIVYQDADIAVINKPQGLTVHPCDTQKDGTLVNALLYHIGDLSGINGQLRPGIVHRIDKDTSGLLVVAKNDAAHIALSRQLEDKTCRREYVALLMGNVKDDAGTIDAPIGRSDKDRKKMCVTEKGKSAVTDYKVLKRFQGYTLVQFRLRTGRTHQIRVHAKWMGHPVAGDPVYASGKFPYRTDGQLLHAWRLELTHPGTGKQMCFTCPLPSYFTAILKKLIAR